MDGQLSRCHPSTGAAARKPGIVCSSDGHQCVVSLVWQGRFRPCSRGRGRSQPRRPSVSRDRRVSSIIINSILLLWAVKKKKPIIPCPPSRLPRLSERVGTATNGKRSANGQATTAEVIWKNPLRHVHTFTHSNTYRRGFLSGSLRQHSRSQAHFACDQLNHDVWPLRPGFHVHPSRLTSWDRFRAADSA